jgi:hypothetical protein
MIQPQFEASQHPARPITPVNLAAGVYLALDTEKGGYIAKTCGYPLG